MLLFFKILDYINASKLFLKRGRGTEAAAGAETWPLDVAAGRAEAAPGPKPRGVFLGGKAFGIGGKWRLLCSPESYPCEPGRGEEGERPAGPLVSRSKVIIPPV